MFMGILGQLISVKAPSVVAPSDCRHGRERIPGAGLLIKKITAIALTDLLAKQAPRFHPRNNIVNNVIH